MPNPKPVAITGRPVAQQCSDEGADEPATPDDPDQQGPRGLLARVGHRLTPRTALFRFLGYVRPHLGLVAGGSVMGILKFTLPLAFPLAFKYVFDVLLVPQPRME